MSVRVIVDERDTHAGRGATLFDCADAVGVRVPTSCHGQGKCRACLVELEEGMDLLTPRCAEEGHLGERFRRVGKAALDGAALVMRSRRTRADLEALVQTIEHVRLETHRSFFDFCADGCQLARTP